MITGLTLPLQRASANGFASASFIQPPDLVAGQGFGAGIAADGNTIAVGSQFSPFVVYVYTNNNGAWTQQARLTSPTGLESDRFGSSVALQGNTLVVGAGGADVAYVFTLQNGAWAQTAVLAPSGGSGASFGGSDVSGLAINGNTIVVGAPSEPTAVGNTGSVYVFVNSGTGWTQQQRIVPSDPTVLDFGASVSVENDTLAIGAPFSGTNAFLGGEAYVFTRQNGAWTQQARLDPVDPAPGALYGFCVSFDGNTVVAGAPGLSEATVWLNSNGLWGLQAVIVGPQADSDFGTALRVLGNRLMIAAYDDISSIGVFSGDAFFYTRGGSTWTQQTAFYMAPGVNGIPGPAQDLQRFGNFGTMTTAGSQTIIVLGSQTFSNPNARHVGAVYTAIMH